MVCCSVFVAFYSHHWTRYGDGERYVGKKSDGICWLKRRFFLGLWHSCRNYGHTCDELVDIRAIWIYGLLMSLNLLFEVLNGVLLLWRRKRVRINLILGMLLMSTDSSLMVFAEELGLIATLLFIIPTAIFCIWGYIDAHSNPRASLDWSFYAFFLSLGLAIVEFICSLVRVVSWLTFLVQWNSSILS